MAVMGEMPRARVKAVTLYGNEALKYDLIIKLTDLSCFNFVHKVD